MLMLARSVFAGIRLRVHVRMFCARAHVHAGLCARVQSRVPVRDTFACTRLYACVLVARACSINTAVPCVFARVSLLGRVCDGLLISLSLFML